MRDDAVFLHLIAADPKFLGPITRMFEAVEPGVHEYVVVGPIDRALSAGDGVHCVIDGPAAAAIAASRSDWDGVLIHGMPFGMVRPVMKVLAPTVAVAWYVWGFEAYDAWPALRNALLLPETRMAANRLAGPAFRRAAQDLVRALRARELRGVLDRYDYCVTQIREEYDLFVATGLLTTTQFFWGSVGALEDYAGVDDALPAFAPDIQVGNSASVSNNHLDAFEALSRMDLGDSRVVVPLSYGDTRYREVVIGAGRRLFGDRFRPLVGFLPLEDYRTVMSQCGHVVMNQCRQQALGNIFDALWRGARVYMNDTTAYTALTRLGFEVGLVVRELPAGCNLRQLSPPSIQRNRELLQEHLSFDHVVDRTGQLLDVLRSGRPRAA